MMSRIFSVAVVAIVALFALPAAGQAQNPASDGAVVGQGATMTPPAPTSSAYVLGRDDVVEVGLLGRTDFGGRARVQADGTIQLPFVGKVPAADRTTAELSDNIREALRAGGYFADPVVTIEVVGYASRYVTVLGYVGSPGLVPINRPYRLSEILARVGGVREGAADYLIVRPEAGEEKRLLIRDLATGDANQDPHVSAGDKIYAPVAETFYIYGQVNSPGTYAMQTGLTVRMALAKAAGLTESGSDKKISVTRAGRKVKVNADDRVEPGDVFEVGERLF
ncbi:polysaccharide biosynthesis/export family protein [Phenylobacterium sp.]|uniref:polysaccharide biosynthesis/export family protein n=1 Tax=Phenylobacterium sp. TaxID=1871053 RepID=UPI00301C1199